MWYALWVTLINETQPRFAGWMFITAPQLDLMLYWIRADPYPCVHDVAITGFKEIKLVDPLGQIVWHTPPCSVFGL